MAWLVTIAESQVTWFINFGSKRIPHRKKQVCWIVQKNWREKPEYQPLNKLCMTKKVIKPPSVTELSTSPPRDVSFLVCRAIRYEGVWLIAVVEDVSDVWKKRRSCWKQTCPLQHRLIDDSMINKWGVPITLIINGSVIPKRLLNKFRSFWT